MLNFFLAGAKSVGIMAHEEKAFVAYMRETNHFFTGDEYHFRLGIFLTNRRYVEEHNKANKGFRLGLNHLSHLTTSEYNSLLGLRPKSNYNFEYAKLNNKAEAAVDWRTKGLLTPIKNQAACGSCWAFSAICCSEARWAQAGNQLLTLSEQNIVDCVDTENGCHGGWPCSAIDYVVEKQNGKFNLESDYPYTAYDGACKFDLSKGVALTKGQKAIPHNEVDLAKAVSDGVVSIGMDASHPSFKLYQSGIYYEPSCQNFILNHAVNAVGYGTEGDQAYWIVRNSWGTSWGEDGYFRIVKDKENHCGVASLGILPNLL